MTIEEQWAEHKRIAVPPGLPKGAVLLIKMAYYGASLRAYSDVTQAMTHDALMPLLDERLGELNPAVSLPIIANGE